MFDRKFPLCLGFILITMSLLSSTATWAQDCTNQVPTMTSNGTPQGQVDASGIFSSSYEPWQAFDISDSTMWISAVFETPAWISYQFTSDQVIDRYSIKYVNGTITTRAPKDWLFQGRTDDEWTTLDVRNNQIDWAGVETRSYPVTSPGSYREYRLYITDDNDDRRGVVVISMGRLSLEYCDPLIFSDGFESGDTSAWSTIEQE
ncbi:MAG: hypothetical protein K0U98_09195 [Deltaproteobacteria bacterium]|nr:hypothetical protein [Deltaproteobacteria bacterium]